MISENRGPGVAGCSVGNHFLELMAVENVVTKNQGRKIIPDEVLSDNEGLRQAIGRRLHSVLDIDAPVVAIPKELLEARSILRGGYDKNLSNTCQQQRR